MNKDDESGKLITLSSRQKVVGQSALAELEQAWWKLAGPDGGVPLRRDVSAVTMGSAISSGFILERIAPGHGRLRVAGRRICDMMGTEARGMPLSALMSAAARPVLAEQLNHVFDNSAIVDLPLEAVRRMQFKRMRGRMLLLPLRDDQGEVTRALGAVMFDEPKIDAPLRCVIPENVTWRVEPFKMARHGLEMIEGDRRLPRRPIAGEAPALRLVVNNA